MQLQRRCAESVSAGGCPGPAAGGTWGRRASPYEEVWLAEARAGSLSLSDPGSAHLCSLVRLTVDGPGTRLRVAPDLPARSRTPGIVDPDEGTIERPVVEVVAHGVPVGEVGGHEAPGAAGPVQVEPSVDHLAEVDDGRAAHMP